MDVLRRNNVTRAGRRDGPPLVLVHGFGCDQAMWRFVTPAFTGTHDVVLLDLVGAGGSDAGAYDPVRHAALEGYAQDLVEVLEALGLSDQAELRRIDAALARIEDGSYGVCVNCGEDIAPARLEAVPDTPLCVNCA